MPSFGVVTKRQEECADILWSAIKEALEAMVVAKVKRKGIDEIKRSYRLREESDLAFLT